MTEDVSERQLWSWVDRSAPELADYLAEHPEQRDRVEALRRQIGAVARATALPSASLPEWIGPYRVTGFLGAGGMGVVYAARQQQPDRDVAVKVLRDTGQDDATWRQRFARECEALGRLQHPAIATIHEAGTTADGLPFLVMERVRGQPLLEFAAGLDRVRRLHLFAAVCDGVEAAHRAGVVHRDLKPSNILVEPDGRPRIVDFGLARIADGGAGWSLTDTGRLVGTLHYMSPEQLRGAAAVDARTDVWSLGVILYELLAGRLPHGDPTRPLPTVLQAICDESPPSLGRLDATLRGDLETIVATALAKAPDRRYPSVGALAADVRRHLDGRPIAARPPGRLYRLRKLIGRRRWEVSAAAATALLVLAAAGWWREAGRGRAPTFADRLGRYRTEPAAVAPFAELRWSGAAPQVRSQGRWYEWLEVAGVRIDVVVALCRQAAGDDFRAEFRRAMVAHLAELRPELPGDAVDVVLRPAGAVRTVAVAGVELRGDTWQALQAADDVVAATPALDERRRSGRGVAPFTAIRWRGDDAEVRVDDRWHQLLGLCGQPFADFGARAAAEFGSQWRKRVGEDLPLVLERLGLPVDPEIEVELRDLETGAVAPGVVLPLTEANRERLIAHREDSRR